MVNGARGQNKMDEEQGGREREEAANSTSLTKVDIKKLWSEICHFKEHFTMKGFFLGLVLGLIPSGWDTFSDFAFAADDHNRTIELINATNSFVYEEDQGNETQDTFASLFLHNNGSTKEKALWYHFDTHWSLDQRTIRSVTYFCIATPSIVTMVATVWNLNIKWCSPCANNCIKLFAFFATWVAAYLVLFDDSFGSPNSIFFCLAVISTAAVLTIKLLAVFVHGPEMKKLSLKAAMAESNNESAVQLVFMILISLWAKEVSSTGLMSMLSSIVMIGKSSAENYLTFGSKNLLRDASLGQQLLLLATTSPVFVLMAIFRLGSFSLICAWDYMLANMCIFPIASCTFSLLLLFLKASDFLKDLTFGSLIKSCMSELSTISLWGHRGRERSRHLQIAISIYLLLLYSSFLLQIVAYPKGRVWFYPSPTYHPDPATLQTWSIITLCSGWIALGLQMLLQNVLNVS